MLEYRTDPLPKEDVWYWNSVCTTPVRKQDIVIYLAGQISPYAPETYHWRQRFIEEFYGLESIEIINPCDNEFNRSILNKKESPYTRKYINVLPSKDRDYVRRSNIGVVDLNIYDPDKPLTGTLFELAWYYDSQDKTVIGVYAHDEHKHPFIKQAVDVWCSTEQQAAEIVKEFFL